MDLEEMDLQTELEVKELQLSDMKAEIASLREIILKKKKREWKTEVKP